MPRSVSIITGKKDTCYTHAFVRMDFRTSRYQVFSSLQSPSLKQQEVLSFIPVTTYSSSSKSTSLLSMDPDGLLAWLSEDDDMARRRFCW